jgi:hypothetical protein
MITLNSWSPSEGMADVIELKTIAGLSKSE